MPRREELLFVLDLTRLERDLDEDDFLGPIILGV